MADAAKCKFCNGTGEYLKREGSLIVSEVCNICDGSGRATVKQDG